MGLINVGIDVVIVEGQKGLRVSDRKGEWEGGELVVCYVFRERLLLEIG